MRGVDILVHTTDPFGPVYFLHEIAQVWEEMGLKVRVVKGPGQAPRAEIAVLHTDITKVPVEYLAKARTYPIAINGHVADISKRTISRNLLNHRDEYDGPVIVKTDRNSGGFREAAMAEKGLLPASFSFATTEYEIFQTPQEIPDHVWKLRDVVVEKFLPEKKDGLYCLRTWVFFGDKETNSICYSNEPIVKQRTIVKREAVDEIPDQLREMREELAFDYGKFDYVIVDGQTVLYDANRTPTLGDFPKEQYMPRVQLLAKGLSCFLKDTL